MAKRAFLLAGPPIGHLKFKSADGHTQTEAVAEEYLLGLVLERVSGG